MRLFEMVPRPAQFHVLPADNTYPIEEFDMFKTATKAPQQPRVSTDVSSRVQAASRLERTADKLKSQNKPNMVNSAVDQVFNTTELIEMILLDDDVRMEQLFVLKRVSKRLQSVIEGSQKLQVKMFGTLASSCKDAKLSGKEDVEQWLSKDDGSSFFNPLMGISPTEAHIQLPLFRHFDFKLRHESQGDRVQIYLVSADPLAGAVEKKLRPHLGGSRRELKISKAPILLRSQFGGGGDTFQSFSLQTEHDVMGDLVDVLSTWYSDQYQYKRRGQRYASDGFELLAEVRFD